MIIRLPVFLLVWLLLAIGVAASAQQTVQKATEPSAGDVLLLEIDGGIGPATRDFLKRGLERADGEGAKALVLRIDTPGGLDAATRDINRLILASPVPVIAWVAPEGARAASAGTYIVYASHLAAMAQATSLGAATPVSLGGARATPGGGEDTPPRELLSTGDRAGHGRCDLPVDGAVRAAGVAG